MKTLNQLFSSLQTGQRAKKPFVKVPKTKISLQLLDLLLQEGWIGGYGSSTNKPNMYQVHVFLKYKENEACIKEIKQVSSSGRRVYYRAKRIRELPSSHFLIISTSQGLMTNKQAGLLGIGGEVFCKIS